MSQVEISSTLFDEVAALRAKVTELEAENFSLAAGQCVKGTPTVGGNFRCCCQSTAGAVGELILRLQATDKWWMVGKGQAKPGEPPMGCVIVEAEIDGATIARAEGYSLPAVIERALSDYEFGNALSSVSSRPTR